MAPNLYNVLLLMVCCACLEPIFATPSDVKSGNHVLENVNGSKTRDSESIYVRRLLAVPKKEDLPIAIRRSLESLSRIPITPSEMEALTCSGQVYHRKLENYLKEIISRESRSIIRCSKDFMLSVESRQSGNVEAVSQCFVYQSPTDQFYAAQITVTGSADWTLGEDDCTIDSLPDCPDSCLHCSKTKQDSEEDQAVTYYVGATENTCFTGESSMPNFSPSLFGQSSSIFSGIFSSLVSVAVMLAFHYF